LQVKLTGVVLDEIKGFGVGCSLTLNIQMGYGDCEINKRDGLAELLCAYQKNPKTLTVTIEYPHWEEK
jgi:hypothetical protein